MAKQRGSLFLILFIITAILGFQIYQNKTISYESKPEVDHKNTLKSVYDQGKRNPLMWGPADLSFIPVDTPKCRDLFPGWTNDEFKEAKPIMDAHNKKWREVLGPTRHVEGHSGKHPEQTIFYWQLASKTSPYVKTICETGFNAGHDSLIWMLGNKNAKLYNFDIGRWAYSKVMASYLNETFPGRLTVIWGDSMKTMPIFIKENPEITCDLIIIDGGHAVKEAKSDWENFWQMANHRSFVILDNYPQRNFRLGTVWELARKNHQINELFRCSYEPHGREGFSFGWINTTAPGP